MSLQPDPAQPGLWVNPDWQPETPGTFAVIIGVSSYDHLTGGAGPSAPDTYDLGQLGVSATTAYQFFRWLRDEYRYEPSPLARCWLLLAPNDEEIASQPALGEHLLRPTFAACQSAIGDWFGVMNTLPGPTATESRAFFFFSGHGVESFQDKQILLPCDYLRPPLCNVNMALSTYNLYAGLAALQIPHQFFFADACRNDHQRLLEVAIEGTPILNVRRNYRNNHDVIAPILYASASGTQAWQPPHPRDGISLFGRALLEGLQVQGGFSVDRTSIPWYVKVYPLQEFVNARVAQLLMAYGATVRQPVRLGGVVGNAPITEISYGDKVYPIDAAQTQGGWMAAPGAPAPPTMAIPAEPASPVAGYDAYPTYARPVPPPSYPYGVPPQSPIASPRRASYRPFLFFALLVIILNVGIAFLSVSRSGESAKPTHSGDIGRIALIALFTFISLLNILIIGFVLVAVARSARRAPAPLPGTPPGDLRDGAAPPRRAPPVAEPPGLPQYTRFFDRFAGDLATRIRIYSLERRTWLPAEGASIVHSVVGDWSEKTYDITLSIPWSAGSHWLEFSDGATTFACVLPDDRTGPPRYVLTVTLDIDMDARGTPRWYRVSRLEGTLARDNDGFLGIAARIWEEYQSTNVAKAADALDFPALEAMLREKLESPLCATVAGIILLRAQRLDLLHDWLRNLANWFPDRPDGPVLWAEQILQQTDDEVFPDEAVDWLLMMQSRGLPQTAETLGYAIRQVQELPYADFFDGERLLQWDYATRHLYEAKRVFRNGGLSCVFAGPDGTLTPDLVHGTIARS